MPSPRRIATVAALGAGALTSTLYGLLFGESLLARRMIGMTEARPPSADGVYGADFPGEIISCLILGDSAAVGYGMTLADDTPPAMLGLGLAHLLGRPVQITSMAVVGARTCDLAAQIEAGLESEPEIALIVIGTNDVTHQVRPTESSRLLGRAVSTLRKADCEVVVATCPDLGTVQPLPQPLRAIARAWSRRLAAQQAVATLDADGRAVSLAGMLGPVFASLGDVMFGEDRFHPSRTGYAHMVSVVLPSLAGELRERSLDRTYAEPPRDVMPVEEAAMQAAQHEGTELVQAGRWATVRRRRKS